MIVPPPYNYYQYQYAKKIERKDDKAEVIFAISFILGWIALIGIIIVTR